MPLTAKQQRFVTEYLVDGNGTQAAIRAGYSVRTAAQIAAENLIKPEIAAALETHRAGLERATVADATERREVFTGLLRAVSEDPQVRLKAGDLLNKMDGLYIQRHEVGGPNGGPVHVRVTVVRSGAPA